MKPYTEQSAFNKVCKHLMTQKKRASDISGVCQLKTEEGLKCAIGSLIPDKKYDPSLEKLVTGARFATLKSKISEVKNLKSGFLIELQEIHDFYEINEWKECLRETAGNYKLKTPACIK